MKKIIKVKVKDKYNEVKTCYTCKYSSIINNDIYCIGVKEPYKVHFTHNCKNWKSKEKEEETMPKTKEAAIDYLNEIGWLQKHDKELTNDWISGDEHNYPKENEIVLARGIDGKPYTARYLGHGMFFKLQPDSGNIVEWKHI